MLVEQYRMNENIMRWSSQAMYQNRLVAHPDVKDRAVVDLLHEDQVEAAMAGSEITANPLLIIDTAGALMHESVPDAASTSGLAESKSNEGEADLVMQTIQELINDVGLKSQDIGVISPYSAQVNLVRKLVRQTGLPKVEVSTVDGFQGREKEVIVISMVRSNHNKQIGFLSNERRMNVAVTRAKRLCVLICDSGTVNQNKFLKGLTTYFKANGLTRSAFDYQGNENVRMMYGGQANNQVKQAPVQKQEKDAAEQSADSEAKAKGISQAERKRLKQQRQREEDQKVQRDRQLQEEKNKENQKRGGRPSGTPAADAGYTFQMNKSAEEIEIEEKIVAFVANDEAQSLEFPATFNSYHRVLVHRIAEEHGLLHESSGQGGDRKIVVTKKPELPE